VCHAALLPTADGLGRVPALEILLPDDAIRNLIRQGEGRADLLVMQTGSPARDADDGAGADLRVDASGGRELRATMMPWNPIHRYAGVQSSIAPITTEPTVDSVMPRELPGDLYGELMNGVTSNPFGNGIGRDVDVSFGHATSIGSAAGAEPSRRPLGFVDVRSDAGDDTGDAATPGVRSAGVDPE
jgi:hypothetical protein